MVVYRYGIYYYRVTGAIGHTPRFVGVFWMLLVSSTTATSYLLIRIILRNTSCPVTLILAIKTLKF